MAKIRFGVVGYGQRGDGMTRGILLKFDEIEVVAVCDEYQDRTDKAKADVIAACGKEPYATTDYRELLARPEVDAVYVATSWETHIEVAIEAMKQGKAVALEVGGAYSIDELTQTLVLIIIQKQYLNLYRAISALKVQCVVADAMTDWCHKWADHKLQLLDLVWALKD